MDERKSSKRVGRPAKPMPKQIPDTPENVMRALINTPPKKKDWDYLKKNKK